MIDEKTALKRCEPNKLDELLHPVFDKQALKEERVAKYPSMEEAMPEIYKELDALQTKLEDHYRDMQATTK